MILLKKYFLLLMIVGNSFSCAMEEQNKKQKEEESIMRAGMDTLAVQKRLEEYRRKTELPYFKRYDMPLKEGYQNDSYFSRYDADSTWFGDAKL